MEGEGATPPPKSPPPKEEPRAHRRDRRQREDCERAAAGLVALEQRLQQPLRALRGGAPQVDDARLE